MRSRIAVQSYERGGWVENVNTKNEVDDRSQMDVRLSLDWDINDTTLLELCLIKNLTVKIIDLTLVKFIVPKIHNGL